MQLKFVACLSPSLILLNIVFKALMIAVSYNVLLCHSLPVPSGVRPPRLTVVSSTSILINWTTPLTPNGGITSYNVFLTTPESRAIVQSTVPGTFLLEELTPFTEYSILLEACTLVGCANSSSASARTMEGGETFREMTVLQLSRRMFESVEATNWVQCVHV